MKTTLSCLFLLFLGLLKAQPSFTVQSSCSAGDSITKIYRKDADRMALRKIYADNSTSKDSIRIRRTLSDSLLRALLAVYNATSMPVRDTLVNKFLIHTNFKPEMNRLAITAPGNVPWMIKLQNSQFPTGDALLDQYMTKYSFIPWTYYAGSFDKAIIRSDSSWNITALAKIIKTFAGVVDSEADTTYNDVTNITAAFGNNFTELTYSYGWGTCHNGCDYRKYWTVRIYTNCVVEYRGTTGAELFTGLPGLSSSSKHIGAFPNPVKDVLLITSPDNRHTPETLEIINTLGQTVYTAEILDSNTSIDIHHLPPGIFYLKVSGIEFSETVKIIKE